MSETPKDKSRPPDPSLMSAPLTDLFRYYAAQQAARQAGKLSGITRGLRADWRKTIVQEAYRRLKPQNQINPYADESIKALIGEYRNLVNGGCNGNLLAPRADDFISLLPGLLSALPQTDQQALKTVGREALLKDMKALGIRSKRRKQRAG